jgi:hypothetical protein
MQRFKDFVWGRNPHLPSWRFSPISAGEDTDTYLATTARPYEIESRVPDATLGSYGLESLWPEERGGLDE